MHCPYRIILRYGLCWERTRMDNIRYRHNNMGWSNIPRIWYQDVETSEKGEILPTTWNQQSMVLWLDKLDISTRHCINHDIIHRRERPSHCLPESSQHAWTSSLVLVRYCTRLSHVVQYLWLESTFPIELYCQRRICQARCLLFHRRHHLRKCRSWTTLSRSFGCQIRCESEIPKDVVHPVPVLVHTTNHYRHTFDSNRLRSHRSSNRGLWHL